MWNVSLRFMRMDSSGPMFMPFWRFSWTSPLKGLLETGTNWKVYCIHFFEFEEWEHHGTPKITIFGLQMNPITFHRNRLLLNHLNLHVKQRHFAAWRVVFRASGPVLQHSDGHWCQGMGHRLGATWKNGKVWQLE